MTCVISAGRKLRKEDHKFKALLGRWMGIYTLLSLIHTQEIKAAYKIYYRHKDAHITNIKQAPNLKEDF